MTKNFHVKVKKKPLGTTGDTIGRVSETLRCPCMNMLAVRAARRDNCDSVEEDDGGWICLLPGIADGCDEDL